MQREILRLLHVLQRRDGAAVLFITHDLGLVAKLCATASVLHAGRVLEQGEVAGMLAAPEHPYTRALLTCDAAAGSPGRCPAADTAGAVGGAARRGGSARPSAPAARRLMNVPPLVEADALRVTFPDRSGRRVTVIHDVNLAIPRGSAFGLVGESGSGKSTLGRALLGLIPAAGQCCVSMASRSGSSSPAALRPLKARMQMIFQDTQSALNPRLSVGTIVTRPLEAFGRIAGRAARRERAAALLEAVALPPDFVDRYPHQLSGGQRQRVGIARAIALEPDFIVADEIVSGLDVSTQAQILLLLRGLRQRMGLTLLFISHDLSVVRVLCDHVAVLLQGEIVETGACETVFAAPRHVYTRRLIAAVPLPDVEDGWL